MEKKLNISNGSTLLRFPYKNNVNVYAKFRLHSSNTANNYICNTTQLYNKINYDMQKFIGIDIKHSKSTSPNKSIKTITSSNTYNETKKKPGNNNGYYTSRSPHRIFLKHKQQNDYYELTSLAMKLIWDKVKLKGESMNLADDILKDNVASINKNLQELCQKLISFLFPKKMPILNELIDSRSDSQTIVKGQNCLYSGDYSEAEYLFRKYLEMCPFNLAANIGLYTSLILNGESKKAYKQIMNAVKSYPNNICLLYNQALTKFVLKEYDDAIKIQIGRASCRERVYGMV